MGRRIVGCLLMIAMLACARAAAAQDGPRCLGPIAEGPARIVPASLLGAAEPSRLARLDLADLKSGEARLTFVGHATFLIESPQGVSVETDYNDYVRSGRVPTIATMNKAHSTHFSRFPDPGVAHVLRGWNPAGGPAAHALTVDDLHVRNVPTNLRNFSGDTEYGANSIFVFETADLCIAHLGHLHHTLEPSHRKAMGGRIDVLLVPIDGSYTLDLDGMVEVVESLNVSIVIPMHFFSRATLERFVDRMAPKYVIERRDSPVLTVSRARLPEKPTIVVLPGR